jgi:hypothetical protein
MGSAGRAVGEVVGTDFGWLSAYVNVKKVETSISCMRVYPKHGLPGGSSLHKVAAVNEGCVSLSAVQ